MQTTATNTATVIPFPNRPAVRQRPDAKPEAPADDRLTQAMANLNKALLSQRAAMVAWKAALGDLRTVTQRLGANMRRYNDSLSNLDTQIDTLRAEAKKLEAWADTEISRER